MEGFDNRWRDLPDYIIGITREIWEGRGVHRLHDWYAEDLIFRMASGIGIGRAAVIRGTMETMHVFPDRALLAEDVIWSGSPGAGMLSSHRVFTTATHLGDGEFGPPTGKRVAFRAIADCHARANQVDDEWLARDQSAICHQLGLDPVDFTRQSIAREGGADQARRPFTPDQDRPGPYAGRGNDNEWGAELADTLTRLMNAELSVVSDRYDRACALAYPGGIEARSHGAAERFWTGLRCAFPSAQFRIDHQIGIEDRFLGPRAAVRWSLSGKHDGHGSFGPPSGADVHIMGFTHADYGPWGLRAEYTVFDETAIWKQILLHRGSHE